MLLQIKLAVLLAPVANIDNLGGPLKMMVPFTPMIEVNNS